MLFTALPLVGVRPDDQPVLAGRPGDRHRRDRGRDDRHRRELHGASCRCSATSDRGREAARSSSESIADDDQAAAVLAADHPRVVPAGVLSRASAKARLFDPLAYSKTFAMAFSTLLTIFLLPIVMVWIFKHGSVAPPATSERARSSRGYRARARRGRSATATRSSALSAGAARRRGGAAAAASRRTSCRKSTRARSSTCRRRCPGCRPGGGLDPPADGQEAEGVSGGRAGVRQARPGRHVDRSGAGRR